MTSRGLSAWFGIGSTVLAILVAVDRPHWFGLQPGAAAIPAAKVSRSAAPSQRSAPWLIKRTARPAR
jgi:hypothetical protein